MKNTFVVRLFIVLLLSSTFFSQSIVFGNDLIQSTNIQDDNADEWKLLKKEQGVEVYTMTYTCVNSKYLFLKVKNTNETQVNCKVKFEPTIPIVSSYNETYEIDGNKEVEGDCTLEKLAFPSMKQEDYVLSITITEK